jgi:hypothetical protein
MKPSKLHNCFTGFLLCAFLLCVSGIFASNSTINHKQNKEVGTLKQSLNTNSYYSELEEDEECNFSVLKSLFVINGFINYKTSLVIYKELGSTNYSNIQYKHKQPIYIINNVFRL